MWNFSFQKHTKQKNSYVYYVSWLRVNVKCGFYRLVISRVVWKYLECGDLNVGFATVKCPDWHHDEQAFSCRGWWSWSLHEGDYLFQLPQQESGSVWPLFTFAIFSV